MKTLSCCIVFVLCSLGATSASAQDSHPQFGIGLGRSIPTGAFKSNSSGQGFNGGWLLTGHAILGAPVLSPRFRLRVDATYAKNGANDQLKQDLTTAFGQAADERVTLLGGDASLVYQLKPGSRFAPSVFAGIGMWHSTNTVSVGGASSHTDATRLGWQLGGEVTRGPVFLELRFVAMAAAEGFPTITFYPLSLGYRFGKRAP